MCKGLVYQHFILNSLTFITFGVVWSRRCWNMGNQSQGCRLAIWSKGHKWGEREKKIDKKCQKEWRSHFVLHYKSILQCLINLFDRSATKNISIKYKYCNTHNHSFSFLVYAHQQLEPYMQSPPASTWR